MMMNVPICPGTRQHLVDANDVKRVHTDPHVERILARRLRHILVGTNTCSLKCLARELLILIRYEMTTEREVVHGGALAA